MFSVWCLIPGHAKHDTLNTKNYINFLKVLSCIKLPICICACRPLIPQGLKSIAGADMESGIRGAPEAEAPHEVVSLDADLNTAVDDLKRHMIRQAMRETGSKTRAAEKLGIPRQSLQKMMKRLNLND